MSRRITLRKCPEHENCQLQSVGGGAWEHTSNRLTLNERLSGRFDHLAEKRNLQESLEKADYLQSILQDLRGEATSIISSLKDETAGLPKTLDLQHKANRAREFLDSQVKIAQEGLERLQRALQGVARESDRQAALASKLELLETRILDTQRQAEETLALATERAEKADALLANAQRRQADLDRVDAVYDSVDQLSNDLRVAVAAIKASDKETRRQIEHERKERLEATAKGIRSLREHIKVSHG